MTEQPRKRITIDAPSELTILAARHLDATEGPVQIGRTVDTSTRSAITQVLRYISTAHNSPAAAAGTPLICSDERHAAKVADLERRLDAARRMLSPDDVRLVDEMAATVEQKMDQAALAEAERDGAYRERAQLLALLAALHPSVIAPAPDVDEPGWQILYLRIGGKQASWHIAPRDADLFAHVEHVPADDRRAQWDGHTTEEKYANIGQHAARLYAEARGQAETPLAQTAPHTGLVVQSYREHGVEKWVFRCWGTDTCDGWLSLGHDTKRWAEIARDRHVAEDHAEPGPCAGFPDRCPNPVDVPAQSPYHGGGVRCGCSDQPKEG